jgi:hypothetical protein
MVVRRKVASVSELKCISRAWFLGSTSFKLARSENSPLAPGASIDVAQLAESARRTSSLTKVGTVFNGCLISQSAATVFSFKF